MKMDTYTIQVKLPVSASLDHPATLEEIRTAMKDAPLAIFLAAGACLEAAGIEDGDFLGVDFSRFPAPPRYKSKGGDGSSDLCLCYALWPGMKSPTVMAKEYCGVWGGWQMVGTRYKHRMNCGFKAEEIFGVVFAAWDKDGVLKWERDPAEFPERLSATPTIHGSNVGDPLPLGRESLFDGRRKKTGVSHD